MIYHSPLTPHHSRLTSYHERAALSCGHPGRWLGDPAGGYLPGRPESVDRCKRRAVRPSSIAVAQRTWHFAGALVRRLSGRANYGTGWQRAEPGIDRAVLFRRAAVVGDRRGNQE